jgi:hypothetical protein
VLQFTPQPGESGNDMLAPTVCTTSSNGLPKPSSPPTPPTPPSPATVKVRGAREYWYCRLIRHGPPPAAMGLPVNAPAPCRSGVCGVPGKAPWVAGFSPPRPKPSQRKIEEPGPSSNEVPSEESRGAKRPSCPRFTSRLGSSPLLSKSSCSIRIVRPRR